METRVLRKLRSTRARKGTRHWDYGDDFDPSREKKEIDASKVMDVEAETETYVASVAPPVENIYTSFGEGVAQTFGLEWNLRDPEVAKDILARSNRLAGVVDTTWNAVQEAIIDGEAEGETIDGIAKRIGQVFTQAKGYRSRVIARTETVGAANAGALRGAVQTGVVDKKVWLAAVDHRTRSSHVSADGQAVPVDKKFQVGAANMKHPGDPAGGASEVVNCRCTMLFQRIDPEDDDALEAVPEVVGIDGGDVTPIKAKAGGTRGTASIGDVRKGSKPKRDREGTVTNAAAGNGKVRKGVTKAREAIDTVHAAPSEMPTVDVFETSSPTTLGNYSFTMGGKPSHVGISSKMAEQATTFVHEFGHYFDHNDFGEAGKFSSEQAARAFGKDGIDGGPLAEWYAAVRETETYKRVAELRGSVGKKVEHVLEDGRVVEVYPNTAFGSYLLDPREVWARTYAQFVAKESGDPDLWEEMARLIAGRDDLGGRGDIVIDPRAAVFPTQWPTDDFEPVAEAMRKLFKEQGLAE